MIVGSTPVLMLLVLFPFISALFDQETGMVWTKKKVH